MDGSRGATGSVDVGVSHLNMNINVTAGGLGTVGIQGNNDATGDTASASSSPPVCKALWSMLRVSIERIYAHL